MAVAAMSRISLFSLSLFSCAAMKSTADCSSNVVFIVQECVSKPYLRSRRERVEESHGEVRVEIRGDVNGAVMEEAMREVSWEVWREHSGK